MRTSLPRALRRTSISLAVLSFLCCGCTREDSARTENRGAGARAAADRPAPPARAIDGLQLGVCYPEDPPGYGSAESQAVIRSMAAHAIEWMQVTPYAYQADLGQPAIRFRRRDMPGLARDVYLARSLGMKVMLKPHIWHHDFMSGKWPADIRMSNDADWDAWFANYEEYLAAWAEFSESLGIEMFSVGAELAGSSIEHGERWRALIGRVRARYGGSLTYAANWNEEFLDVPFWDALDVMGVQFFYPLSKDTAATFDDLVLGARTAVPILDAFAMKNGRRVLFTEVGFRSERGSFIEPWQQIPKGPPDLETQRRAYDAILRVFPEEPWFAGLYFWEYEPDPALVGPESADFTPQGKPAEATMAARYRELRIAADAREAAGAVATRGAWAAIERAAAFRALGETDRARSLLAPLARGDDRCAQAAAKLLLGAIEFPERCATPELSEAVDSYRAAGGFPSEDPHGRFPLFVLLDFVTTEPEPAGRADATCDALVAVAARVDAPRAIAAAFQSQLGASLLTAGRPADALAAWERALALRVARESAAAGDPLDFYPARASLDASIVSASRLIAARAPQGSE